jgi:hypothetical protein
MLTFHLDKFFYKRSKLLDARKSSAVLSRDAQMRRLMQRQAENSYRKMEAFIINRLKEIMKGNRFEFFIPKVLFHYLVILLTVFRCSNKIYLRSCLIGLYRLQKLKVG